MMKVSSRGGVYYTVQTNWEKQVKQGLAFHSRGPTAGSGGGRQSRGGEASPGYQVDISVPKGEN